MNEQPTSPERDDDTTDPRAAGTDVPDARTADTDLTAERAAERAAYLARTEPPHADPRTLRSAHAFDGSGPYLYGPDGSGPYAYAPDGRGPYLVGSPALSGAHTGWSGAFGTAPGTDRKRRKTLFAIGAGVAALAIVGGVGGTALGLSTGQSQQTTSSQSQGSSPFSGNGSGSQNGFTVPGYGSGSSNGSDGSGSGTSTESAATAATTAQKKGVVTIDTVLNYDTSSQAAGTGMILTKNGYVLTNNHVVQGATSITVTDESTGKEYTADVVGTDSTNDVAVLKLQDASGLSTVTLDDDGDGKTGDTVTDIGNAEGTGNLVAAEGTVTATDQDITVQSESGSGTESLTGLIEVAADIVSGDSGGPVLDEDGEVVGMATAASSGSADVTGYAIPIDTAKSIADDIIAGKSSDTITIGLPAFLGVQVSGSATTSGVQVA
ncbi:MAG: trypsin-like peptidase domain-containing protein, partial [Williamsia herbipolensis]|nr:trypsin-like peptidase domain-containing protein [Williamsia herbipolensis]